MNFYKILTPLMLGINILSTTLALPSSKTELIKPKQFDEENPLLLHRIGEIEERLQQSKESFEFADSSSIAINDAHEDYLAKFPDFLKEGIKLSIAINEIFSRIADSFYNTIYQELFIPDQTCFKSSDLQEQGIFENKIIFKLTQIINKELKNQFNWEVKPFEVYLKTTGAIKFFC